jgi:hypothetical protein
MKVIAGIASIPSRVNLLEQVLDSLAGQVDEVFVGLNYGDVPRPKYLDKYSNVFWWVSDNSRVDAEKFAMANIPNVIYLGCDDDLVYLSGYADYMVKGVEKYDGLVSLHGRTYLYPVTNFKKWAGNYRCLNTVSEDVKVNLIGSGCCAFNTNRLKVSLLGFPNPNMADVFLSKTAHLQGVPMRVLKHQEGEFLRYLHPVGDTIWEHTKDYSLHVKILQSFIE